MADVNETLQQLVQRRARELGAPGKPLTVNALAKRANGMVSYETFRRIEAGLHNTVGDRVADGLALALDVPASHVLAAAGQRQRLGRFELPRRADRLVESERKLIIEIIDGLLEAGERRQVVPGGPGRRAGKYALSGWKTSEGTRQGGRAEGDGR